MICVHRFVVEYIEEFLKSPEYTRLQMFQQEGNFVLKVDDEEVIKRGLLDIDLRGVKDGLYKINRISVTTNYYDASNYTLSPVIVGQCQINLVKVGDDDVKELIFQREMGPHHINCGVIQNKKVVFENSNDLYAFKNGFKNCSLVMESMSNIRYLNQEYKNYGNHYHFKHLTSYITHNSLFSKETTLKELKESYKSFNKFLLEKPDNIKVNKCEILLKYTNLDSKYDYDNLLNLLDMHINELIKNNYTVNKKDNMSLIVYLDKPNIDFYKHVDSYIYALNKKCKKSELKCYTEILCMYNN